MAGREELLERLLSDPAFRKEYLAGEGRPLEELDTRESRSSLAGVMLGAAVEGVALFGLADHADAAVSAIGSALENHNLTFDADGIADLRAGRIDSRVVAVLDRLSRDHHLTISSMRSDHSQLTAGGSVSNHSYGRAVDIAAIDGKPVNADNAVAKQIAVELSHLDPRYRPTEIGSPWAIAGTAYFTDADHQDHLHIAFDDPPKPGAPALPIEEAPEDDADDAGGDGGQPDTDDTDDEDDSAGDDDEDDDDDEDEDDEDDEDDDDDDEDDEDDDDDDDEDDEDDDEDDEDDDDDDDEDDEDDDDEDDEDDGSDQDDSGGDQDDTDATAAAAPWHDPTPAAGAYPGPNARKEDLAAWMSAKARERGLPSELPIMAALVESGLTNLDYGDADSVGFFQMRVGIWNTGAYAGYPERPELQLAWFLDQAEAVKEQRVARGLPIDDPKAYGEWIADIERPAAQYRGRYQLQLDGARALLERAASSVQKLRIITPEEAARARGN